MKKQRKASIISKRIFRSMGKIGLVLIWVFFVSNIPKIQGTSSFFSASKEIGGSAVTAGYWVVPEIEITNPDAGDVWQVGSKQEIVWTVNMSDPVASIVNLDLAYSCGDDQYAEIAHFSSDPGNYHWTVPEDISQNCKIKVTATDSHNLSNSKESDEFEISWLIVLNEFMPKPVVGLKEWVELYNKGDVPIDVSGWRIKDELNQSRVINPSHTNTGSTIINPKTSRFLVVQGYDNFYLNDGGDTLKLSDDSDRLLDSHTYVASDVSAGKTIARIPDGVGDWVDPVPTPGKKNVKDEDRGDFEEYYKEVCFENNKPICDLNFLKSLRLVDDKSKTVVENNEIMQVDLAAPEPTNELVLVIEPKTATAEDVISESIGGTSDNVSIEEAENKVKADDESKPEVEQKAKTESGEKAKTELDLGVGDFHFEILVQCAQELCS